MLTDSTAKVPAVEMRAITKRFGALVANDAVDLNVAEGSIHAIVGENGAGKTTLMRMLYGVYRPDAGGILMRGQPVEFANPKQAIAVGIGMVSQHYSIIPELTILDNLMLGAEMTRVGILQRNEASNRAQQLAEGMGFAFDWRALAATLSPASAQKLEILKLLWRDADILILDEPTAMLSPSDSDSLFDNLQMLSQGADGLRPRTVLFVTHRLQEVMSHARHVTVLRGGRKVAEAEVRTTSVPELTRWIVGETMTTPETPLTLRSPGRSVLQITDLTVRGRRGDIAVDRANLELRANEIVGIAGVDGNGQSELIEALVGLRSPLDGSIRLEGRDVLRSSTRARMNLGLRYLPEDRHRRAVIEDWSVAANSSLGFQRDPSLASGGWMRPAALRARAEMLVREFSVKTTGPAALVRSLSGGNQQRLVVARTLFGRPSCLVAFQPTRGLDIRGAQQVYEAIRDHCAHGMAALIISFDLDELLDLCDRIAVMYRGQLIGPLQSEEMTRERIGALMVGAEVKR